MWLHRGGWAAFAVPVGKRSVDGGLFLARPPNTGFQAHRRFKCGCRSRSHTEILFVSGGSCLAQKICLGQGKVSHVHTQVSDCAYTSLSTHCIGL